MWRRTNLKTAPHVLWEPAQSKCINTSMKHWPQLLPQEPLSVDTITIIAGYDCYQKQITMNQPPLITINNHQSVRKLLQKLLQIWQDNLKSFRLSSQSTVGGSKIDANRGLLGHDELSSNGKRMRVLRVTFQLEPLTGQK